MSRAALVNQVSSLYLVNRYSLSYEVGYSLACNGYRYSPRDFFWATRLFVFILQIDGNCFGNLTFVDYLLVLNFWVLPRWNKACAVTQFPPRLVRYVSVHI